MNTPNIDYDKRNGLGQSDPICGACSKPLSKHDYIASRDAYYCEPDKSYEFDDEPREELMIDVIEAIHPGIYKKAVERWKRENGHLPNVTNEFRCS